jgi:molybdopterin/thiamine biosynthesis adenylyltransferase
MLNDGRFSRNIAFFGVDGQLAISAARAGVVGVGGLGSHVVQQLAYLGVTDFVLIDPDVVSESNLNRLVGGLPRDAEAGTRKVEVARRVIKAISPDAHVEVLADRINAAAANELVKTCSSILVCVDADAARLQLTRLCCESRVPFFDLATDTGEASGDLWYGGRVLFSGHGDRCPSCMDLLNQGELARGAMTHDQKIVDARIYGVARDDLDTTGPSVVGLNGVVASLAVMEWMVWVTELREPRGLLEYRGSAGAVFASRDVPREGCYYCSLWSRSDAA